MQPKALIPMMTKSAHTATVQYIANFDISASQSHFSQITENEMKKNVSTAHENRAWPMFTPCSGLEV